MFASRTPRFGRRRRRIIRKIGRCTIAVTAAAGAIAMGAVADPAAASSSGSIVFIKADNVWLMRPDGTGQRQITTDGKADAPYVSPSQADDGTIVALRNQHIIEGTHNYLQGVVSVLNRNGQLMRPVYAVPQYDLIEDTCPTPVAQQPDGIVDAQVSPDGQRIAYVATAMLQGACGDVFSVSESIVANLDGGAAATIGAGGDVINYTTPSWISNTKLVVTHDDLDARGESTFDVGAALPQQWFLTNEGLDFTAHAIYSPSATTNKLAAAGSVENDDASEPGIELWTTGAPGDASRVVDRCVITDPSHSDAIAFDSPSWSADGQTFVFTRSGGANPGIVAATYPNLANSCANTQTMLAAGGSDASWGTASYDAAAIPPPTTPTGPTPPTAPTTPAGSSFSALTPARLLETRSGPGIATVDGAQLGAGPVAAGSVTQVQVAGRGGVPADASGGGVERDGYASPGSGVLHGVPLWCSGAEREQRQLRGR